jgi:hypothetical protein
LSGDLKTPERLSTKRGSYHVVAELHAVREAHAKKFNYDLDAIFKDFKKYEQKLKELRAERSKKELA